MGVTAPRATKISIDLNNTLIMPTRIRNRQHAYAITLNNID